MTPLRGSKHVAWLKYTNSNSIFNIVVFDGYPSSYEIFHAITRVNVSVHAYLLPS
jgi:hypothetical protein